MSQHPALTDSEYTTPGAGRGIIDVFRYRYLLSLLLKKSTATRYYGSVLGWVWSYIRPGAQFLMYYLVIGVFLGAGRNIEGFPIYLFAGIIAVNLFSEALRNTTTAIVDNKSLVQKIYLPRELFPIAALGTALIHFLPQAFVLFVVVLFLGWTISWLQVLAFVGAVVLILLFALGLGLFFGAINVAFRDAANIVDLILMFATWTSPVLYAWWMVADIAPRWVFHLYMSNPMTVAVELFHNVFWFPLATETPRPDHLLEHALVGTAVTLATLIVGQLVFRRLEKTFAQSL